MDYNIDEIEEIEEEYEQDTLESSDSKMLDSISEYLKLISKYKVLSKEEEVELARKYKEDGDKSARETLLKHNLKLVVYVAKKYNYQNCLTLLDLIQEGNIGLMTAVERFDYTKGYKFSTYAICWIRQSIKRSIDNSDSLIRIPVHANELIYSFKHWKNEYIAMNGKEPSYEECEEKRKELGIQQNYIVDVAYLDTPVGEDKDTTLGDMLADERQVCEKEVSDKLMSEEIDEILNTVLSERERNMLKMRYGFDDGEPKTLQEVAEVYGVTRERVRQVVNVALRRLRYNRRFKAVMVEYK